MKEPDRKECPCCGVELKRQGLNRSVEPECGDIILNENGELASCSLFWKCLDCGCRWQDGQKLDGIK